MGRRRLTLDKGPGQRARTPQRPWSAAWARCGYYDLAVLDRFLEHSPAHHLKLPKVHADPARQTWLNRFELGALLRAARVGTPTDWALVSLMGTIGMRVSATCSIRVEDITTTELGYRILHTIGKGDKPSVKVLPIPVMQAVDAAVAGRTNGWLLLRRDGSQMTRRSADRVLQRLCREAGIAKKVSPHSLRRSFATLALQAGVDVRVVQDGMDHASTRTTLGYDRLRRRAPRAGIPHRRGHARLGVVARTQPPPVRARPPPGDAA